MHKTEGGAGNLVTYLEWDCRLWVATLVSPSAAAWWWLWLLLLLLWWLLRLSIRRCALTALFTLRRCSLHCWGEKETKLCIIGHTNLHHRHSKPCMLVLNQASEPEGVIYLCAELLEVKDGPQVLG